MSKRSQGCRVPYIKPNNIQQRGQLHPARAVLLFTAPVLADAHPRPQRECPQKRIYLLIAQQKGYVICGHIGIANTFLRSLSSEQGACFRSVPRVSDHRLFRRGVLQSRSRVRR